MFTTTQRAATGALDDPTLESARQTYLAARETLEQARAELLRVYQETTRVEAAR